MTSNNQKQKLRLQGFTDEWEETTLEAVLDEPRKERVSNPQDFNLLTVQLHCKGVIATDRIARKTDNARPYYKRFTNEIIIGRQNFHNGGIGLVKEDCNGLIASNAISSYTIKGNNDLSFILQYISRKEFYKSVEVLLGGTGQKEISSKLFLSLHVSLPKNIAEQQAIAYLFTTLDNHINLLQKELKAHQDRKKCLLRKLFVTKNSTKPQLRLLSYTDKWVETTLGEVAERVTRKNTTQNDNNLTISAEHGLINQEDFFTKRIASKNNEHYYLLLKDEFAYNKSYSAGYPFGVIKRLDRYEAGAVSTLYICFRFKDGNISLDFMEQYFNACIQDTEIKQIAQEGARNHGLLNIPVQDFFSIKLYLPSLPEQQAIATLFTTIDTHIANLSTQLNLYTKKKKALLQNIFLSI